MTEIITYSLRSNQKCSDRYYQDIAVLSDEVLAEIRNQATPIVDGFQAFLAQNQLEDLRSFDEYAYELLMLGVFWRVHMPAAVNLPKLPHHALASFGRWRRKSAVFKPVLDLFRGVLGTIFLSQNENSSDNQFAATRKNLTRLLEWIAAVGDFPEELDRLENWDVYIESLSSLEADESLRMAINLGSWFEARSQDVLGAYTPNVESFINQEKPFYRWREDVIFCSRQRIEYHLATVGTEILNRSLQKDFLSTENKVVLLPPCMKAKLDTGCGAVETPLGERCMACEASCRVHQLTKLGEKQGFTVLIMPHDLDVFSGDTQESAPVRATGVVGVSCPLTNPAGGWEMKKAGTPAQGVLLDYCGCPWHWHKEGIPTDINFNQVLRVLGIKE